MRRPTLGDIAELAGVSIGSVSLTLNHRAGVAGATRARVLAAAEELGWRPDGAGPAGARVVGLVPARPGAALRAEPAFGRFLAGLEGELSARGVALLLQVAADHTAATSVLRSWWTGRRVDGVVLTDLRTGDGRVPALASLGIPAVLAGPPRPDSPLPTVWGDDDAAVAGAVGYLAGLGHRRVAHVAGPPGLEHTRVRTAAFRAEAERRRLERAAVLDGDGSFEAGKAATEELLAWAPDLRPTAIVYDDDVMALGGLAAAWRLGVCVPGQLSIVAGEDSPVCRTAVPPLTALSRDVEDYGAAAARMLLALVAGQTPGPARCAVPRLVVRGSTAEPFVPGAFR